jgi:F0F1-type ATP synthase membrane subunit b/b'
MDIQHLVDRLEDLIDEGRHMPMSKYTLIDEERALEIIDQMRISIPEEIEKAARILAQRDRILAQAHEESARIVQGAREKGDKLIENDTNVQAARNQAANIIEQAKQDAEAITREADDYAIKVFSNLKIRLNKLMNDVHQGIEVMQQTEPQPSQPLEFAPPVGDSVEVPLERDDDNTRYQNS